MAYWTHKPPLGTQINFAHPLAKDLVGYWLFNEGAGGTVYDLSLYKNHGTLTNMDITNRVAGEHGYALAFDGDNDYVELGTINSTNSLYLYNQDVTICAWFNQDNGGDQYQRIVDKSDGGAGQNGYCLWADANGFYVKQIGIQVDGNLFRSNDNYSFNTWVHVCGVITSSEYKIYLDGVETNGLFVSGSATQPPDVSTDMSIGTWNHSTAREFDGIISDVRIYSRALTANEIAFTYANPYSFLEKSRVVKYFVPSSPWYVYANQD